MNRKVVAFVSGAIFAARLCVSGMTHPSKVLAFLDVTGAWDPSLAFVMVGAVGISALAFRLSARRASPIYGDRFRVPDRRGPIDPKLVAGAALFGVGWGLSGLCPGPAVTALVTGQLGAIVFVTAMVVGMAIHRLVLRAPARDDAEAGSEVQSAS